MKNLVRKSLSVLLLFVLIFGMLPATALAADDVEVLTSIGHKETNTVTVSGSQRNVTLTAPYGTATVDLEGGIDLDWGSAYSDVVASFQSGSVATAGGAAVQMLVTYYLAGDTTLTPYTTTYNISIVAEAYKGPTFSGALSKTARLPDIVTFTADDFEDKYSANDGKDIGSILIEGSNRSFGALQYNGADYTFDSAALISMTDIDAGKLTFTATDAGEVSYIVRAFEGTDKVTPIGSVLLKITIEKVTPPTVNSSISKSVNALSTLTFSASDFTSHCNMNLGTLTEIEITPTNTGYGTWYNGSTPITSATTFASSAVSSLKFTGAAAGTATFTWRVKNEADYSDSGTGTITVSYNVSDITCTTNKNTKITFSATNFNTVCTAATGANLDYVKFTTPSASSGKLYYNYTSSSSYDSVVSTGTSYYRSSTPSLSNVTFVPYSNYTGTVTISYTGYDTNGASYAGKIVITVKETEVGTITYPTSENETVVFDGEDFNNICEDAGYNTLDYIKITSQISNSSGKLYYNYTSDSSKGTAVTVSTSSTTGTKLYYSTRSTPYLDKVAFVPYSGYDGTVTISYTGYDTDGATFTGTIKITVEDRSVDTVTYSTAENENIVFNGDDFNDVCEDAGYDTLDYIKISPLPDSSDGKLYYNYVSSSSKGTAVATGTKLYYDDTPNLDKVAFIPYSGYDGTVTISYTGYDEDGKSFSGKIKITVTETDVDAVTYTTGKNETVVFDGDDFNDVCEDEDYDTLNYIRITSQLSSSCGKLYYNYTSSSSKGTAVTTGINGTRLYYDDTPNLDKVAFIPYSGYTGTVIISYTGYDEDAESFSGTIKITVEGGDVDTVTYTADEDETVVFDGGDFNDVCEDADYETLDYIKITSLPSSSYGKLYYNYVSSSSKGTAVATSTKLYYDNDDTPNLDKVAFVPYSGYNGTVTINYTGYDEDGESYSGTIKITVAGTDVDTVAYSAGLNETVVFDGEDFNDVCEDEDYETLDYIKITSLPSSSCGKLYYNYASSSSKGTAVSTSTKLYYDGTPSLDKVAFVPYSGYSGTVSISYTGYDEDGESYSGTIRITYKPVGDIAYTTKSNTSVAFNATDFNNICNSATGENLSYVKFTLPSSSYGKLYYNYQTSTPSAVSATTSYYRSSSPSLSYVSFLPASGYSGTVSISYTGYSSGGDSYTGTVKITVSAPSGSKYFTDVGSSYSWAVEAIDYLYGQGIVKGTGASTYSPGANITRGDFMLMLYRALDLKATTSGNFTDVAKGTYYYDAIAVAKALGIAQGSGGYFYPTSALTRQDAMALVYRAMQVKKISITAGTSSDLASFTDRGSVSSYATTSVATLVKAGIIVGDGSKLTPLGSLTRAQMAVILYRVLKL